jgi:hypothetical protein
MSVVETALSILFFTASAENGDSPQLHSNTQGTETEKGGGKRRVPPPAGNPQKASQSGDESVLQQSLCPHSKSLHGKARTRETPTRARSHAWMRKTNAPASRKQQNPSVIGMEEEEGSAASYCRDSQRASRPGDESVLQQSLCLRSKSLHRKAKPRTPPTKIRPHAYIIQTDIPASHKQQNPIHDQDRTVAEGKLHSPFTVRNPLVASSRRMRVVTRARPPEEISGDGQRPVGVLIVAAAPRRCLSLAYNKKGGRKMPNAGRCDCFSAGKQTNKRIHPLSTQLAPFTVSSCQGNGGCSRLIPLAAHRGAKPPSQSE